MSNRARAGLVALAVVVVAVAFVALRPGDSGNKSDDTGQKTSQTESTGAKGPTATAPSAPAPPLDVTLKGGAPVGGVKSLKVKKGDMVRLQVRTDEKVDQLHLHGYDIEKEARASKPANFAFKASIEGVFELESHTAEHAGRESLMARLVVEPR